MSIYEYVLPSPEDIRGARSYLGWGQETLAEKCNINTKTLSNIENKKSAPTTEVLEKIHKVFFKVGVLFNPDGGFYFDNKPVKVLEGDDGVREFFADVLRTAEIQGGELLLIGMGEESFRKAQIKAGINRDYRVKLDNMKGISYKVLTSKSELKKLLPPFRVPYGEYRGISEDIFSEKISTYIYGDKVGTVFWLKETRIIVVKDKDLSDMERKQYDLLWKNAEPAENL